MSYINALNLFELKDGYSIEELKQTYRALSKKYHPDYKQNASLEEQKESEEMMKKISFNKPESIKNVIFNDPATIVFWNDGTKTVVKAENEEFDPEKGLAMAISKKVLGNKGNYYETFKKWLPEKEGTENG